MRDWMWPLLLPPWHPSNDCRRCAMERHANLMYVKILLRVPFVMIGAGVPVMVPPTHTQISARCCKAGLLLSRRRSVSGRTRHSSEPRMIETRSVALFPGPSQPKSVPYFVRDRPNLAEPVLPHTSQSSLATFPGPAVLTAASPI